MSDSTTIFNDFHENERQYNEKLDPHQIIGLGADLVRVEFFTILSIKSRKNTRNDSSTTIFIDFHENERQYNEKLDPHQIVGLEGRLQRVPG